MEFTGERFMPEVTGRIEIEHLHRYFIAKEYAKDKIVLDIASGEGYGTAMLAEIANYVYGVDISAEAVAYAREKYSKIKNVEFWRGIVRPSRCLMTVLTSFVALRRLSITTSIVK